MNVAIISHPDCLKHEMQEGHPECPARLQAIDDRLIASGLADFIEYVEAPLAERKHLELAHDKDYVDHVFKNAPGVGDPLFHVDPDTWMGPYTLNAALRAAGAVVEATDIVMSGRKKHVFCNVRPPGHHAEHDKGMGFCFFNNIAVGALHAVENHGLERVVIVDFDVHHGNGSEDIAAENPKVMYCSTYQEPLYPGYAGPSVKGLVSNVPLPPGAGSLEFRQAVTDHWLPDIDAYAPQLIFISAGFDAHIEDDMAGLEFLDGDYAWVTTKLCELADKHAEGRIVSALEGGYIMSSLGRGAAAHIKALMRL